MRNSGPFAALTPRRSRCYIDPGASWKLQAVVCPRSRDEHGGMRMKRNFLTFLVAVAALALSQAGAFAHHGNTAYSTTEPYTVSGTVTEFQFLNPHCIVLLEAKDEKGTAQKWQGEL